MWKVNLMYVKYRNQDSQKLYLSVYVKVVYNVPQICNTEYAKRRIGEQKYNSVKYIYNSVKQAFKEETILPPNDTIQYKFH